MSPEILARKLSLITGYLQDLQNVYSKNYTDYLKNHYAIERLIEVLVMAAVDVLFHLYSLREEPPPISYSTAFLRAGELGIIDAELASQLARAAGMRNLLVHGYEKIDQQIIFNSVPLLIRDMEHFVAALSAVPELKKSQ